MDDVARRPASDRDPVEVRPLGEERNLQPGPGRVQHDRKAAAQGRSKLQSLRRHPVLAGLAVLVLIGIVAAGVLWWLNAQQFESTDDAFIDARTVSVSPQVSAAVVAVPITDNQEVKPGDVLVRLDQRDFRAALDQAKAQVEQAKADIANLKAQIQAQQSNIEAARQGIAEAEAALEFSRAQSKRAHNLLQRGAGTEQQAQQAASDLKQKQAAFDTAKASTSAAEKQIAVLQTQVGAAEAKLDAAKAGQEKAQLDLAHTTITAPIAGRVTNLSAAKGNFVQPGQALMILVPDQVWVTANFKETQLANMHPGEPVKIHVDAYPDRTFHGHVAGIQAGSGSAFSLLPAENATGNFVKVVQRVPVKIVFDHQPNVLLGPGMSVEPTVKVK